MNVYCSSSYDVFVDVKEILQIMEKTWKVLNVCIGLLYCELCNGLPINLENTVAGESPVAIV